MIFEPYSKTKSVEELSDRMGWLNNYRKAWKNKAVSKEHKIKMVDEKDLAPFTKEEREEQVRVMQEVFREQEDPFCREQSESVYEDKNLMKLMEQHCTTSSTNSDFDFSRELDGEEISFLNDSFSIIQGPEYPLTVPDKRVQTGDKPGIQGVTSQPFKKKKNFKVLCVETPLSLDVEYHQQYTVWMDSLPRVSFEQAIADQGMILQNEQSFQDLSEAWEGFQ